MGKVRRKRIRRNAEGFHVVADVNAVVASNTSQPLASTATSSRQRVRIVQRDGRMTVTEQRNTEQRNTEQRKTEQRETEGGGEA